MTFNKEDTKKGGKKDRKSQKKTKSMSYRDIAYLKILFQVLIELDFKRKDIFRMVQIKVYDRVCSLKQLIQTILFILFFNY